MVRGYEVFVRLSAAIEGDLKRFLADELKAGEDAVTAGVREATNGLKLDLRQQITGAGLGRRLANTWRSEVYPKGKKSIRAAGLVFSKAPNIVRAYADGAVIRSRHGFFLAIPTQAAGRYGDGKKKMTPGLWERMHGARLKFVYRRRAPSLLVAENRRARTGKRGGFGLRPRRPDRLPHRRTADRRPLRPETDNAQAWSEAPPRCWPQS